MFLSNLLLVPESEPTSTSPTALCNFCDGGTVRQDTEIPYFGGYFDGQTCGDILTSTESEGATSESCGDAIFAEALCCPSKASTCSICKGVDLRDDVIIPGSGGLTCVQLAYLATLEEMTSANCTNFQDLEAYCCPDPDIHNSKCYLCGEDGVGMNDEVQIPDADVGVTCGLLAQSYVSYDLNSPECLQLTEVENLCCPFLSSEPSSSGNIFSPPPVASPPRYAFAFTLNL